MKFIIPLLVILIFLVIVGNRIRKQRNLMQKRDDYEKKLREAKVTRYKYIQALQKTREYISEVEEAEERLIVLKAELIGYRKEQREMILHLRQLQKKSTGSELDKRTIAQQNNILIQHRAHTNMRKRVCMDLEKVLDEARDKLKQQENHEHELTNRWFTQKDQVIKTYRELKDQLVLTDPQDAFS